MTRKEAKAILENDIVGGHVEGNARFMDAFWMAVDALSQEPRDDVISRDAVLSAICDYVAFEEYEDKSHTFTIRPLTKRIKQLPSVTQKSGKWIDYRDDGFVECPFCGHATNCEDDIDELHYCFYCGAKMESEDKE